MYILGISGSPRKNGNTDILLDKALQGARSARAKTEKITLNNLTISPCQECANMPEDGTCKIRDDFQKLYEKIKIADGVILASPIFFGSLSAQVKIMIDRFQCLWRYKEKQNAAGKGRRTADKKRGALILVEASERESFLDNAKSISKNFFATAGIKYGRELFCRGIDLKGAVTTRPECLEKAYDTGKKLLC